MQTYIKAGALVRRPIRRFLMCNGIIFYEEKGWVNSIFSINCSEEQYDNMIKTFSRMKEL